MTEYRDHQATIFVAPAIAGLIGAIRREWHVSLVHPRTSGRGGDFRDSGWSPRADEEFVAREVAITVLDRAQWVVLRTIRLRGEGERRS
jgi:hypothetical protein